MLSARARRGKPPEGTIGALWRALLGTGGEVRGRVVPRGAGARRRGGRCVGDVRPQAQARPPHRARTPAGPPGPYGGVRAGAARQPAAAARRQRRLAEPGQHARAPRPVAAAPAPVRHLARRASPRLPDRHRLGAAARVRLHRVRRPARPPRRGGLRAGLRTRPALCGLHLRLAARPRRGRPRPRAAARGAGARGGRPRRALPPGGAQHGRPGGALVPALRRGRARRGRAGHVGRGQAHGERAADGDAERRQHPRARRDPRRRAGRPVAHDARGRRS